MKKKALILTALCGFSVIHIFSQININATIQIDGFRHNWDCGTDATGNEPDPRYKVWLGWDNANFVQSTAGVQFGSCFGLGVYGADDQPCSYFNPGIYTAATFLNVPANQLNVDMQSWEDDNCGNTCTSDGSCAFNDDDTRCGRLRIGDIDYWNFAPCADHTYIGEFTSGDFLSMNTRCSDNNGGGYGIDHLVVNWSFASAPTITTQPTAVAQGGPDRLFCIGTGTSMTVAVNSFHGWSLGMFYQWQVNDLTTNPVPSSGCPVTGWTNIAGATSATYIPPQTPGTKLYRCLITSNCTPTFTSQTVATECVRITYQPFAAPIVSAVCGLQISPGTPYTFCTTQEPNVGASIGASSYTWTVSPAAGVTIANPTLPCTDITFTTNSTYTITLTYGDACPGANPTSTCVVDIAPAGCNTVYVDANNGNDANFGYENTPVQTVFRGMQLAGGGSRKWIRIEGGAYNEGNILNIGNDMIIEGGWVNSSGTWTKSSASFTNITFTGEETVSGVTHRVGFKANSVTNWALQDLGIITTNVTGQDPSGRGKSNYGVWMNNCSNYNIRRCAFTIGSAGVGSNGSTGSGGANGANGTGGGSGSCDGNYSCCFGSESAAGGNGGAGGVGGGGVAGGGSNTSTVCANPNTGANGSGRNGGGGGAGGKGGGFSGGNNANCGAFGGGSASLGQNTVVGIAGGQGDPGGDGSDGGAGSPGSVGAIGSAGPAGIHSGGFFVPGAAAGTGGDGTGGSGGAGGGGGGRQTCATCDDGPGNGAAGGGGGGQGGTGGTGGRGGGGVFAIYRTSSNTGATITQNSYILGAVGSGGAGGAGGGGGSGGSGGPRNTTCNSEIGEGGAGGAGGAGGTGGQGGTGSNGTSAQLCSDGTGSSPSVVIPNPTTVTIDYEKNANGCVNSEIDISRPVAGTWTLPAGASFINDINSSTSSFGPTSNSATIWFNATGVYGLTHSGSLYSGDIRILDGSRTVPVISTIPSVVCSGTSFSLAGTSYGTQTAFEWIVFTDSATVPSNVVASSNLQYPSFTLSVPVQTIYNIRYRVKEQCCGWSKPVYGTVTVNPPVGTPSAPAGATSFCKGTVSTVFTTLADNASSYVWTVSGAGNTVSGTGITGTVFFDPTFVGTGQVCVTADGCAGPSATVCTTFNVGDSVGTPVAPLGITSRCTGLGLDTFVTWAPYANSYIWSVTGTGNGAGGTTDTSTISWDASFTGTAQVCVQAIGCGSSPIVCSPVDVLPNVGTPTTPVGLDSICQDSPNGLYIGNASAASDYLWSISGTGNTITNNNDSVTVDWDPAFNGSAQICISSIGCGANQGPVCLTVDVTPTVGLPTSPSGTAFRCIGPGTDNYSSTATSSVGFTWVFSPAAAGTIDGAGTVTWSPLFSGTAQVGVIANGCNGPTDTTFLAVVVSGPVGDPSIPSGTATRCQGIGSDIYTTSATNATSYTWSVTPAAAGSISGTSSSETVNWDPTYSGTASVCVIAVGCNGNSIQECFSVTINPSPPTPIITVTGTTSFCDGGSAVLTSSSPTNNNWLPNNETTPSITVTQSGTYSVEVTNGFGCTSTSTNQSIVVFANTINPSVIYNDTVCSGNIFNIVASGTGVVSYVWSTGDTTAIITPTIVSQTAFSITMTDNNGCTADSTFFVEIYPFPDAVDDNNITDQDISVSTFVIWNDNMNGILSVVTQGQNGTAVVIGDSIVYTPDTSWYGTDFFIYSLCNKDCPTQCDTARVTIVVDPVYPLMIPGGFSPNGDGHNDVWSIQGLENYPQNRLTVINRWGDIIYQANPYNNDWDGTSNTGINITNGHVTDGTYFYVFIPSPGADPIQGSLEIRRN